MSHRHTAWGRRQKTNQIIFSAERCCKVINIRVVIHQVLKPRNLDLFWQRMPFTSFNNFSWPGLSGKDRKYKLMRSTIPLNICISSAVTPVASLSTNAIADKPNSRIILPKWNDSVFRVHEGGTEQLIIQKGEIYRPRCNHDNFFSSLLCFSILAFPCRSLLSNLPQVVILNIHKCLKETHADLKKEDDTAKQCVDDDDADRERKDKKSGCGLFLATNVEVKSAKNIST